MRFSGISVRVIVCVSICISYVFSQAYCVSGHLFVLSYSCQCVFNLFFLFQVIVFFFPLQKMHVNFTQGQILSLILDALAIVVQSRGPLILNTGIDTMLPWAHQWTLPVTCFPPDSPRPALHVVPFTSQLSQTCQNGFFLSKVLKVIQKTNYKKAKQQMQLI